MLPYLLTILFGEVIVLFLLFRSLHDCNSLRASEHISTAAFGRLLSRLGSIYMKIDWDMSTTVLLETKPFLLILGWMKDRVKDGVDTDKILVIPLSGVVRVEH